MGWKVNEWTGRAPRELAPMTDQEIEEAIKYLRDNNYPKPDDCPREDCPSYRPACGPGICHVAVVLCGDF